MTFRFLPRTRSRLDEIRRRNWIPGLGKPPAPGWKGDALVGAHIQVTPGHHAQGLEIAAVLELGPAH